MREYDESVFYEQHVETNDPLSILISKELPDMPESQYRECSLQFIRIMELSISYILESRNPTIACWAVAFSLGLPVCDKSIRELSRQLGISSGTISASMKKYRQLTGLPRPIPYTKHDI